MIESTDCINCGSKVMGKYCHDCSQPNHVRRLNFATLIGELQSRYFGIDNKFMRTIRDLTIRPDEVARVVIQGNKVRYIGAVSYFFILLTIVVLLISILDIDMATYSSGTSSMMQAGELSEEQKTAQTLTQNWIFQNFKMFTFAFVPLMVLATSILFYKSKYNAFERSIMIIYWQAHPMLVTIASLIIYRLTGFSFAILDFIIALLYAAYFSARFFTHNKKWFAAFKGLFILPLGIVIAFLIGVIGFLCYKIVIGF